MHISPYTETESIRFLQIHLIHEVNSMKTQAFNPYLPSFEYIPDGEPHLFGDRVYVYGSHDRFNGKGFCLNNYVCWSAPVDNLGDWRFEGEIYQKTRDPLCIRESLSMYAPDVQKGTDGKYYLFYFLGFEGVISVAVCDQPAGEFHFLGHVKHPNGTILGKAKGDPFMFDPGVFLDDDGRIYLYTGFSPKWITRIYLLGRGSLEGAYVTELESDFLTVKTAPRLILDRKGTRAGKAMQGHGFFEASSMRKYRSTYYFIYSSEKNHELCYATSNTPIGPFVYGGTLISNADIGYKGRTDKEALNYYGNNHGSMLCIKDDYYIFYHRQTNRHEYSRQGCAESVHMDSNGKIEQVEMTSCGLNGGPLMGKGTYSAHIACNLFSKHGTGTYSPLNIMKSFRKHPYLTQSGLDREDHPDQYVANLRDGAVVGYKYFKFDHLKKVTLRLNGAGNGSIQVLIDPSMAPLGETKVQITSEITEVLLSVPELSGIHPLYFRYQGNGYINLRSFTLE